MKMSFDEAVIILKRAVKYSHLDNQKHVDLSIVPAAEVPKFQRALMIVREKVNIGEMSESDLKETLGIS